jgi:predicted outer membrane protein
VECEEIEDSTMLSNNQTKSQVSTPTGLPSQSDESDIDRLVALHQKRNNSLSSLGVSDDDDDDDNL